VVLVRLSQILIDGLVARKYQLQRPQLITLKVKLQPVSLELHRIPHLHWIVFDNNIVSKRAVVTSSTYKNNWVIKSGLKTGDTIIVTGAMMLRPGSKVAPKKINPKDSNNMSSGATKSDDRAATEAENNKTSSN
jgi:hypothetical protein